MNETGNKVDVPLGKLLTRILGVIFPGDFRSENIFLGHLLWELGGRLGVKALFVAGGGAEEQSSSRGVVGPPASFTGLHSDCKARPVFFLERQFEDSHVSPVNENILLHLYEKG